MKIEINTNEYNSVRFLLSDGREVEYIPLSVINSIKAKIEDSKIEVDNHWNEIIYNRAINDVLEIIDRKVKEYRHG